MSTKANSVLVTGAEGFIGSHLVEKLVAEGREVRAYVLYNSFGRHGWLDTIPEATRKKMKLIMGDVRDPFSVREAMRGCDAVMHLAALIAIPYSYAAPASYVDVNVMGTLNVVQAARDLGLQKVVHTSTSEVYGTAQFVPISETHPLVGQSPYSASKIGADQMALSYHCAFGVPVATVRPFNTYGPRQSLRAVIPTIILQALEADSTLSLGSVSPTRDFNFVEDTVGGMIAVLDSEKSIGETINIGSGFEITISETVEMIAELMGRKLAVQSQAERMRPEMSEVERLCCDNSKAQRLLGWKPKFADREGLREGLRRSIAWFSESANRAHYHDVKTYVT